MQNGFNHRKIASIITLFTALLLVITFYGCRTSKRIVEKSKVDIEKSELKINKIDSSISIQKNSILNKVDSLSWNTYMKYFDLSYSGIDKDDFLEFTKTEKGFKLSGKGNINIKNSENRGDSLNKSNNHQTTNEYSKVNSSLKSELKSNDSQIKINKNKENQTLGFTIGVLIALILVGALIIYLLYKYLLKKKS